MKTNENRFEALGWITSIKTSRNGNTLVTLKVDVGNGKEIHPTFFLQKGKPIHVQDGKKAYISGHVMAFDESQHTPEGHTHHSQWYSADYVYVAKDQGKGKRNSEFFKVFLTGRLVRILDSGNGWKRIGLETTVKENGEDYTTKISVDYYTPDRNLIRVSDLIIGNIYEVIVKPVTPDRVKDGKPITYQNLIAVFSREIVERESAPETAPEKRERKRPGQVPQKSYDSITEMLGPEIDDNEL